MEPASSFRPDDRVGITEKGQYDLIFAPDCICDPKLVGLLVQCAFCGTVYGHLSELDPPKKHFFRRRRR